MKKAVCFLLAVLFAAIPAGCAREKAENPFESDREIVTYERIDPKKTQVVVCRTGNIDIQLLCDDFEAENPDVQIIYADITGGNDAYKPLVEWVVRGYAPDVVISAASFFDETLVTQYFENLSTDPIIQNYEAAALKRTAIDADVYFLPGPSNISAMMYNKTLFAKYGWETPATFDEFVALCDQIRADTNGTVEPWNPNAKYSLELQTALEAFTYEELFGGAENRAWYNDLLAGKATFAGHMEPYMQALQTLAEHGILREEHFTYSATTRGKEFAAGKIAMLNMDVYDADNDEFDFGYMPFPTTKGELGYLSDSYSCFAGLPIKEHTAAQNDAIARFLAFFSSPAGQKSYIGKSMKISNVKGVPLGASDDLAALQPAIDAGHMFAVLNFAKTPGEKSPVSLQQYAMDMTSGAMTGAECIAAADAALAAASAAPAETPKPPEVLATVAADMTILETSFYIADFYREAAGADIGLIANNLAYRGNVMRLFAGDITPSIVTVLKPRSFANDSALVKLSMTGEELLSALNHPEGGEKEADCIYAYSGLQCEIAPWNAPGTKYVSVKLADGTALKMDATYTVAVWEGTVAEAYGGNVLARYEGSWEELMRAKFAADGTVAPPADGRIKLIWE